MPTTIQGYTTEFQVKRVADNDTDINNEITTQGVDNWLVVSLTLSGTDMVILFTRTQTTAPEA